MDRYRRHLPSVNKHLTRRRHVRSQKIHRSKLANIRSIVDSKKPSSINLSHMKYNPNKEEMKQQQYMKIQHENTILLNKIGRIMAHGDELLDHRETTQKYSKSMNIRPRKDEFAKINAQNIAMLQRLKETRAHVNVDDLENTFLKGTLVYSGIVNKQPGSQLRTKSRGSSPGKRSASWSPRKRRPHPFDAVANPRAEQTAPKFLFRTTKTPYKSGRDAARIALEEANSRDMTKLMNKGRTRRRPLSQPDLTPIPSRSSPPKSLPSEPIRSNESEPNQQDTDETALDTATPDDGADDTGNEAEVVDEAEVQQPSAGVEDTPLDEATKDEPAPTEMEEESEDDKKDADSAQDDSDNDNPSMGPEEAREALIRQLLKEEHARWAAEEAAAQAKIKAEKDAREALIQRLIAEQYARWAEEDAIAEAERKAEIDAREAMINKLVAKQQALWAEEDAIAEAERKAAAAAREDLIGQLMEEEMARWREEDT